MLTIVIAVLTAVVTAVASLVGLILLSLALPSAKGHPTRRKTAQLVGLTTTQARDQMAEKLQRIGCDVQMTETPAGLVATRKFRAKVEQDAVVSTHADRALKVTVELAQHGASALARTTVRIDEFILVDSGEGRYAEGVLDWLTDLRDQSQAPPCPPTTSSEALCSIAFAAGSLAAWALPLRIGWPPDRAPWNTGFALGLALVALLAISGARSAFRAIALRPNQLTGRPLAVLSFVLAIATLAVSATVLVLRIRGMALGAT